MAVDVISASMVMDEELEVAEEAGVVDVSTERDFERNSAPRMEKQSD